METVSLGPRMIYPLGSIILSGVAMRGITGSATMLGGWNIWR